MINNWQYKKTFRFVIAFTLTLLMVLGQFGFMNTHWEAHANPRTITITGAGINNPGTTFSRDQIRGIVGNLPQRDVLYSTVNTWPTKSWYRGQGVRVMDLINAAGGLKPEATMVRFISNDGFITTFTIDELFNTPRYRFPNFMSTGTAGHIPGDPSGAVLVEPMIAHRSFNSQDISDMSDNDFFSVADTLHLLYGQRYVSEQTNAMFSKWVTQIEILTTPIPKWNNPTANPPAGEVPAGTSITLNSQFNDLEKVHYTLDGSTPDMNSPMFNWIASRWWASRQDVLSSINRTIGPLETNTTIKAVVIGPGRLNSDVMTFEYQIPSMWSSGRTLSVTDIQPTKVTLNWTPAKEGVTSYKIYRDGVHKYTVAGTAASYLVAGLTEKTNYKFKIEAGDAQGNWSTDGPGTTVLTGDSSVGGANVPFVTDYGTYYYKSGISNNIQYSPISVKFTGNTGGIYNESPWETLTDVPLTFDGTIPGYAGTAIGVKLAVNVTSDSIFTANKSQIQLVDGSNNPVAINVIKLGGGSGSDQNRNYLFIIPQSPLQPSSAYKLKIGPNITGNNGQKTDIEQQIDLMTTAHIAVTGVTIPEGS